MEWNVLAAKLLHTGSCAALAEFSLHESFTEHIQVPKSKLEVNQISKLKIRNKEFLAVIRLASPSNKEEGGVQFLFPLFAVQVFEKR